MAEIGKELRPWGRNNLVFVIEGKVKLGRDFIFPPPNRLFEDVVFENPYAEPQIEEPKEVKEDKIKW